MNQFQAPFLTAYKPGDDLKSVSAILGQIESQHLDNLLWSTSGYMPEVTFSMAYANDSILLRYAVKEKYISAVYRNINEPVYKDTCVELFIAFNNEANYYNLEFNCLGTALVGFGSNKQDRIAISKQLIERITSYHLIKTPANGSDGLINWELTVNIPFSVFGFHQINSLANQICSVNFYKCGDELPEPHYLSWNNIIYPEPNFHLPEFFGKVKFA